MLYRVGDWVIDRRTGEQARIASALRVPRRRDLFGHYIAAHTRYVLAYCDGRWADNRYDHDLERACERELAASA